MNEILKIFVSLSVSGTILILILFFCKPLYKYKLNKQWQYYIWLIVIARLLIPLAPQTNIVKTIFNKLDNSNKLDYSVLIQTEFEADIINSNIKNSEQSKFELKNIFDIILHNIWAIWLVIAAILLIRKITIYQSFVKYIKAGRIEVSDIGLWEALGQLVEQSNINTNVELYVNNLISSPLLIGFFKPCIMLPSAKLSDLDFKYTILHELSHYKRGDMFYKWLVQFTICLHWFNPFVYLMGNEINRACELCCDELVIKNLEKEGRQAYGEALLNSIGIGGSYKSSVASVTLNESKELLEERLDSIIRFNKRNKLNIAVSITLVFVLCFGASVTGAFTTDSIPQAENTLQPDEVIFPKLQFSSLENGIKTELGPLSFQTNKIYTITASWKGEDITLPIEIIMEDGGNSINYTLKNNIPVYITVPQNGIYFCKLKNDSGSELINFLCTVEQRTSYYYQIKSPSTITINELQNGSLPNPNSANNIITNNSTQLDNADIEGLRIIEGSGTWGQTFEQVMPYMSSEALEKAIKIYIDRHIFPVSAPEDIENVEQTIQTAYPYMTEQSILSIKEYIDLSIENR